MGGGYIVCVALLQTLYFGPSGIWQKKAEKSQKSLKKLEKIVDFPVLMWYYMQAVDERAANNCISMRNLKTFSKNFEKTVDKLIQI